MTKEEAYAYYRDNKNRANAYASDVRKYKQRYENKEDEKNRAESSKNSSKAEKKNFEKRLEDVKKIIHHMNNNLSDKCQNASSMSKNADNAYRKAIVSPDIPSGDFHAKYDTKGVFEDANSSSGYNYLEKEKQRLENGIAELNEKIKTAQTNIDTLTRQIRDLKSQYNDSLKQYRSCDNNANYYYRLYNRL